MSVKIFKGDVSKTFPLAASASRQWLCLNGGAAGCKCRSCLIKSEYNPDLLVIDDTSVKKERADEIIRFVSEVPTVSENRVVQILHGEGMTTGAANALLKVLEDGPGKFILCTTAPLMDTVRSRGFEIVCPDSDSGEDTFGLSRRVFRSATGNKASVAAELGERGFFKFIGRLCEKLENIEKTSEILEFFGEVKEKDPTAFFSNATPAEVSAVFNLLQDIFFGIAINDNIINDRNLRKLYTAEKSVELATLCSDSLYRYKSMVSFNKNDFFNFLKEFVLEK